MASALAARPAAPAALLPPLVPSTARPASRDDSDGAPPLPKRHEVHRHLEASEPKLSSVSVADGSGAGDAERELSCDGERERGCEEAEEMPDAGDEGPDETIESLVGRAGREAAIGGTSVCGTVGGDSPVPTSASRPPLPTGRSLEERSLRILALPGEATAPLLLTPAARSALWAPPMAAGAAERPLDGLPRPLLPLRVERSRRGLRSSEGMDRSSCSCLRAGGRPGCSEGFKGGGLAAVALGVSTLGRCDGRGGSMSPPNQRQSSNPWAAPSKKEFLRVSTEKFGAVKVK